MSHLSTLMKALGFGFGFNFVSTSMRKGLHQNGVSQGSPTLDLGHISNIKRMVILPICQLLADCVAHYTEIS